MVELAAHAACSLGQVRHLEYFHDHVRVGELLLEGVLTPSDARLVPDLSVAGNGLRLRDDADRYEI